MRVLTSYIIALNLEQPYLQLGLKRGHLKISSTWRRKVA